MEQGFPVSGYQDHADAVSFFVPLTHLWRYMQLALSGLPCPEMPGQCPSMRAGRSTRRRMTLRFCAATFLTVAVMAVGMTTLQATTWLTAYHQKVSHIWVSRFSGSSPAAFFGRNHAGRHGDEDITLADSKSVFSSRTFRNDMAFGSKLHMRARLQPGIQAATHAGVETGHALQYLVEPAKQDSI